MDNAIFDIYGDIEQFDAKEELKNVSENEMLWFRLKRRVNLTLCILLTLINQKK